MSRLGDHIADCECLNCGHSFPVFEADQTFDNTVQCPECEEWCDYDDE